MIRGWRTPVSQLLDVQAGGSRVHVVQGHPQLHSKLKASLGYMRRKHNVSKHNGADIRQRRAELRYGPTPGAGLQTCTAVPGSDLRAGIGTRVLVLRPGLLGPMTGFNFSFS